MALLGVSRLRVSADPQVLNEDRLKLLAVKLRVVPWKRKVVSVLTQLYLSRGYWAPFLLGDTAISCINIIKNQIKLAERKKREKRRRTRRVFCWESFCIKVKKRKTAEKGVSVKIGHEGHGCSIVHKLAIFLRAPRTWCRGLNWSQRQASSNKASASYAVLYHA